MAFDQSFKSSVSNYFFGDATSDEFYDIVQVTNVDGLAVEFNLILPQVRGRSRSGKSVGLGALRVDYTYGVQNPIKIRIGTKFQPLSSTNVLDFVTYVSDIIFDYAGFDAQALLDEKSDKVKNPNSRKYLPSVAFLNGAKRYAVDDIVDSFFSFVYGRDDELLTQLRELDALNAEQIQAIHSQAVSRDSSQSIARRLFIQEKEVSGGQSLKNAQIAFNKLLNKQYPKLLGPIEQSKGTNYKSGVSDYEDSEYDNTARNLYIAAGIVGVMVLGFAIGRRRS